MLLYRTNGVLARELSEIWAPPRSSFGVDSTIQRIVERRPSRIDSQPGRQRCLRCAGRHDPGTGRRRHPGPAGAAGDDRPVQRRRDRRRLRSRLAPRGLASQDAAQPDPQPRSAGSVPVPPWDGRVRTKHGPAHVCWSRSRKAHTGLWRHRESRCTPTARLAAPVGTSGNSTLRFKCSPP